MNTFDQALLLIAGYIIITFGITLMLYHVSIFLTILIFGIGLIPLYVLIRSDESIF